MSELSRLILLMKRFTKIIFHLRTSYCYFVCVYNYKMVYNDKSIREMFFDKILKRISSKKCAKKWTLKTGTRKKWKMSKAMKQLTGRTTRYEKEKNIEHCLISMSFNRQRLFMHFWELLPSSSDWMMINNFCTFWSLRECRLNNLKRNLENSFDWNERMCDRISTREFQLKRIYWFECCSLWWSMTFFFFIKKNLLPKLIIVDWEIDWFLMNEMLINVWCSCIDIFIECMWDVMMSLLCQQLKNEKTIRWSKPWWTLFHCL